MQATVSRDYLVYSAADIIAHSIEAYFTAEYRPEIIDFLVESNIKTVIRTTEILLNDPQDLNARGEFFSGYTCVEQFNAFRYLTLRFPKSYD